MQFSNNWGGANCCLSPYGTFDLSWYRSDHNLMSCEAPVPCILSITDGVWVKISLSGIKIALLQHAPHAGSGWRIHCGVEVTELSTNKQHTLLSITDATQRACNHALNTQYTKTT